MEIEISKQKNELRSSNSSINSNPELKNNSIFFLRISLIIINIISGLLGFYIYENKEYYLDKEYNFEYYKYLLIFIFLYSFGMLFTFVFAFILSLLIKIIVCIFNSFSKTNENKSLIKEERPPSENSIRYINANSDEISLIPYTLTWFIVTTSIIYFLSLPYTIFLFVFIRKNKVYSNMKDFRVLYSFLVINFIAGLIMFYVILIVIFVKREGSFRKRKFSIDDKNLENLKDEIRGAMENVEQ